MLVRSEWLGRLQLEKRIQQLRLVLNMELANVYMTMTPILTSSCGDSCPRLKHGFRGICLNIGHKSAHRPIMFP